MIVRAMARRWRTSQQKGSALLLRLAIAGHARDDGTGAYSTLTFLADKIRISQRYTLIATDLTFERLPPWLADAAPDSCPVPAQTNATGPTRNRGIHCHDRNNLIRRMENRHGP